MSKESFYFSHDYDPTGDPKIQTLIGEYGASGYGIYWRIIEMLHSDSNHKLPLKQFIFLAIAKQMLTSAEQIQTIIHYCIDPCELFVTDKEFIWSNRVNQNFEKRAQLSEIRSLAGKAGAIAKQNPTNASKEKEIKRIKEKKNAFVPPTLNEVKQYFKEKGYREEIAIKAFTGYDEADWIDSQGNPVLNWKQKMVNVWFDEKNRVRSEGVMNPETGQKVYQHGN
jgi:hypothetical protein